jgi:hypothetical protein
LDILLSESRLLDSSGVIFREERFHVVYHTRRFTNLQGTVWVCFISVPCLLTSYGQALASIDIEDLPCDISSMLTSQVNDGLTDVFNSAMTTGWVRLLFLLSDRIYLWLVEVCYSVQVGGNKRARDTVNSDSESC